MLSREFLAVAITAAIDAAADRLKNARLFFGDVHNCSYENKHLSFTACPGERSHSSTKTRGERFEHPIQIDQVGPAP
jgi:hypothetical protein